MNFSKLNPRDQDLLDAYLDGTITPADFEELQNRMAEHADLRRVMRRYLSLDHFLQTEANEAAVEGSKNSPWTKIAAAGQASESEEIRFPSLVLPAVAAVVAFLLGSAVMYWGGKNSQNAKVAAVAPANESLAHGFAVIENLFDAEWDPRGESHQRGEVLGAENFKLASGIAEIQFFSGATMTLRGPAEISLKSAWEAICQEGAVHMKVPPAARGFKLQAPSTEIVDLGTEFGLVVRDGAGKVEVFDGEISIRHQGAAQRFVTKGGALDLSRNGPAVVIEQGLVEVPDRKQFEAREESEILEDFQEWTKYRDALAADQRLIAYYGFDRDNGEILVPNLALPRNPEFDGAVIMAEPVAGRWTGHKTALEFNRPGSRVRVNITGEFPAFTFMSWVRIDSLDRWYNALFMGDGYETGEPHWQIRNDGKMMLSVMVDDTRPDPGVSDSAGHHKVYFSPPIWELSMSGQWLHVASVFDPGSRAVSHFLNGKLISQEAIPDDYFIDRLRIGNAEIGNWGQPFREESTFAIRNLNGRMDELAIFNTALDAVEISKIYKESRSNHR